MSTLQQILPSVPATASVEELACFQKRVDRIGFFDARTVGFLDEISQRILRDQTLRQLPAFVSLAYWLRKANIETLRKEQVSELDKTRSVVRQPLGLVFHVCPSNVDTIFLYSLAISLLAGNRNVLRVSHRMQSPALTRLFNIMETIMQQEGTSIFSSYCCVVAYGHEEDINAYLSAHADARILWGGDKTVSLFRSFPTAPRCRDIAFPDRTSCSIISSDAILRLPPDALSETCRQLYNDTFVFDQLGCSSPQVFFFLGDASQNEQAKDLVYDGLHHWAKEKYHHEVSGLASLKLNRLSSDAMEGRAHSSRRDSNLLFFVDLNEMPDGSLHGCGGGYLYVKGIGSVDELETYINKKVQTVGYFGLDRDAIIHLSQISAGLGLDRIVPIGKALAFNDHWDGYDLLDQLTALQYLEW